MNGNNSPKGRNDMYVWQNKRPTSGLNMKSSEVTFG